MNEVAGEAFRPEALPPGKVAVLFTADWCGYCQRFLPHFKQLRDAWVVDASDDDHPVWDEHALQVVPTVVLFEDGAPKARWQGRLSAQHMDEIRAALAA